MKEMCDDFVKDENSVSATELTAMETRRCHCSNGTNNGTDNTTNATLEMDCNAWLINTIGLSQAYVAPQPNANKMTEEQGLVCGTAFPDLVQPYVQGSNLVKFL